jgi:glucan-binding YG repeat protein
LRRFWSDVPKTALYMSKRNWQVVLSVILMVSLTQCSSNADKNNKSDVLLARAYDKSLYLSQLEGVVPEGIRGQDSLMRIYAYAYQWVNDQLLMYEAERNIPKNIDIDQLVRDYRASLVKHNYEEHIIVQKLDTVVTEREQEAFYNENRDQFQLESTILKCLFLKMPNDAPQNELNKIWYNRSDTQLEGLKKYAAKWAVRSFLEPKK